MPLITGIIWRLQQSRRQKIRFTQVCFDCDDAVQPDSVVKHMTGRFSCTKTVSSEKPPKRNGNHDTVSARTLFFALKLLSRPHFDERRSQGFVGAWEG